MVSCCVRCCDSLKYSLVTFKLKTCCCLASVKIGIYIIAYFNLLLAAVSLLSEGRFSPIAKAVQNLVSSEGSTLHQLTNITKIFFNVLLLVAVNKKITVLLRVFIYYSIASITVTIIVLAPIIEASEDGGLAIGIITAITTLFDCYMMLLVRSIIVEINGETPTKIVFTSLAKDENGQIKEPSVEITSPSPKQIEENRIEGDETLETVNESPNEVTFEVK